MNPLRIVKKIFLYFVVLAAPLVIVYYVFGSLPEDVQALILSFPEKMQELSRLKR